MEHNGLVVDGKEVDLPGWREHGANSGPAQPAAQRHEGELGGVSARAVALQPLEEEVDELDIYQEESETACVWVLHALEARGEGPYPRIVHEEPAVVVEAVDGGDENERRLRIATHK